MIRNAGEIGKIKAIIKKTRRDQEAKAISPGCLARNLAAKTVVNKIDLEFSIEAFGITKHNLVNVFPPISSLEFEGFLLVKTDGFMAARRSTLSPAKLAPKQKLTYKTKIQSGSLYVEVVAVNYLHELCLLSEVIDTGTQVDSQLISLLPGDSHTFEVTGSLETLTKIEAEIESLLWSHNRLVNP